MSNIWVMGKNCTFFLKFCLETKRFCKFKDVNCLLYLLLYKADANTAPNILLISMGLFSLYAFQQVLLNDTF